MLAMQSRGLKLITAEGESLHRLNCTDKPESLPAQDFVIVTLKAHSVPKIVPQIAALLAPGGAVVTAVNGIPWWYFQRHGGSWENIRLESVDPGGVIASHIPTDRLIGCVAYPAAVIVEPGIIEHIEGNRFSIGELDGSTSDRCRILSKAIVGAGLRAPIRSNIRQEIWVKLLGNIAFNPVSALTKASMLEIATDPDARAIVRALMDEANAVAEALGIKMPVSIDQRMAGAEKVGEHATSMLQDVDAAKPLEVGGLVGSVLELGRMLGIPMPYTSTVYACTKLLGTKTVEQSIA